MVRPLVLLVSSFSAGGEAFLPLSGLHNKASLVSSMTLSAAKDPLEDFLDSSFYDPHAVLANDEAPEWSQQLARWIIDDYETAEAFLAGGFLAAAIVVGQAWLRLELHHGG